MTEAVAIQTAVDALNLEYETYVRTLRTAWLDENRVRSKNVYEIMSPDEHALVHRRIAEWAAYVTPFAEAWWHDRGYRIEWPADASQPVKIFRLAVN